MNLRIVHNLVAFPGTTLKNLRQVYSHPVALAQCERFFAERPRIRRVAADDTAGSVAQVVKRGDPTRAAVAGRRAAEIYGGHVLRERVEDDGENYTRFLLLAPAPGADEGADKLSLVLKLPHKPGALHAALEPFARRRIDLLKIESRPVKGEPWEYHIFLDLCASLNDAGAADALDELRERTASVRLLGHYPSARVTESEELRTGRSL